MRKLLNSELGRLSLEAYKTSPKIPVVIVMDNVRSAYNVGSAFRTADAFAVEAMYLCGISAQPPHKDIHKTALGAYQSVNWQHFPTTIEAIQQLKEKDYLIIPIEQVDKSISLENFKAEKDKKYALVFGHEVKGVDEAIIDMADACIEIPQFGTKHSLNISVSVGVVLWTFSCFFR